MSDTLAAILILPVLAGLVIALECGRVGCTHLTRRYKTRRAANAPVLASSEV